jgi:hypothetical protein
MRTLLSLPCVNACDVIQEVATISLNGLYGGLGFDACDLVGTLRDGTCLFVVVMLVAVCGLVASRKSDGSSEDMRCWEVSDVAGTAMLQDLVFVPGGLEVSPHFTESHGCDGVAASVCINELFHSGGQRRRVGI